MAAKIPPALPDNGETGGALPFAQRIFYVALCGVATLCIGAAVNGSMLGDTVVANGYAGVPPARIVLADLAESQATERILFIGNSQFLRGIQPDVLDREFAGVGCDTASFVAAYPLLNAQEKAQVLRAVEAMGERGPTRIVLEATIPSMNYRTNPLSIDIQSFARQTRFETSQTAAGPRRYLSILKDHVRDLALGLVSYRRLQWIWPVEPVRYEDTVRGYLPFAEGDPAEPLQVARALNGRQSIADVTQRAAISADEVPVEFVQWAEGFETSTPLVMLTMPSLDGGPRPSSNVHGWIQYSPRLAFLNLNDAQMLPAISQPSFWQDTAHLSNEGAVDLSVVLASYLCPTDQRDEAYALR